MKYPCGMIRDLLPLFYDGVCSEESSEVVREHLRECAPCREVYEKLSLREALLPEAEDPSGETVRAKSYANVRLAMKKRQLRIWGVVIVLVLALSGILFAWNEHGEMIMPYQESMQVYFDESGNLVMHADLPCSAIQISQILLSPADVAPQQNHVFLRYYCRPLDYMWCSLFGNKIDSTYVIAFAGMGADLIDAVHYTHPEFENFWFRGDIPVSSAVLEEYISRTARVWIKE